jgi:hypothetical protein
VQQRLAAQYAELFRVYMKHRWDPEHHPVG